MGFLERMKGVFRRKKEIDIPPIEGIEREPLTPEISPPLEPLRGRETLSNRPILPEPFPRSGFEPELASETKQIEMSNIKAKIDLLLTEMDSLKMQNQTINERLKSIEKMLAEMRGIRYY